MYPNIPPDLITPSYSRCTPKWYRCWRFFFFPVSQMSKWPGRILTSMCKCMCENAIDLFFSLSYLYVSPCCSGTSYFTQRGYPHQKSESNGHLFKGPEALISLLWAMSRYITSHIFLPDLEQCRSFYKRDHCVSSKLSQVSGALLEKGEVGSSCIWWQLSGSLLMLPGRSQMKSHTHNPDKADYLGFWLSN